MHAFVYVVSDFQSALFAAKDITGAKLIIPFKLARIDDTRELIKLTNTSLAQKTCYVLEKFEDASIEAQNAFLKRLEEPQKNLSFVLHVQNESNVLSTITSRCEVIRAKTPSEGKKVQSPNEFLNLSLSKKMILVSKITKREEAVAFLEKIIEGLHSELKIHPELASKIKKASETLDRINKNANPSLQLASFVLALN